MAALSSDRFSTGRDVERAEFDRARRRYFL
jgi:hypothetical protein